MTLAFIFMRSGDEMLLWNLEWDSESLEGAVNSYFRDTAVDKGFYNGLIDQNCNTSVKRGSKKRCEITPGCSYNEELRICKPTSNEVDDEDYRQIEVFDPCRVRRAEDCHPYDCEIQTVDGEPMCTPKGWPMEKIDKYLEEPEAPSMWQNVSAWLSNAYKYATTPRELTKQEKRLRRLERQLE